MPGHAEPVPATRQPPWRRSKAIHSRRHVPDRELSTRPTTSARRSRSRRGQTAPRVATGRGRQRVADGGAQALHATPRLGGCRSGSQGCREREENRDWWSQAMPDAEPLPLPASRDKCDPGGPASRLQSGLAPNPGLGRRPPVFCHVPQPLGLVRLLVLLFERPGAGAPADTEALAVGLRGRPGLSTFLRRVWHRGYRPRSSRGRRASSGAAPTSTRRAGRTSSRLGPRPAQVRPLQAYGRSRWTRFALSRRASRASRSSRLTSQPARTRRSSRPATSASPRRAGKVSACTPLRGAHDGAAGDHHGAIHERGGGRRN